MVMHAVCGRVIGVSSSRCADIATEIQWDPDGNSSVAIAAAAPDLSMTLADCRGERIVLSPVAVWAVMGLHNFLNT